MTTQLYKRSNDALFSEVGDDIVALNVERGPCYGMEKVTAVVWALLAEPTDVDSICRRLMERYDVAPEICRSDVDRLIGQFRGEGLVEEVASSS